MDIQGRREDFPFIFACAKTNEKLFLQLNNPYQVPTKIFDRKICLLIKETPIPQVFFYLS